jgi:hypothetical protein
MERVDEGGAGAGAIGYRLVVDGEIGEEWASWFGECTLDTADGRTAIEVTVTDQAALHGLLRRIHDLHLRLVSLTRQDDGIRRNNRGPPE